jgi:hypothetical protein
MSKAQGYTGARQSRYIPGMLLAVRGETTSTGHNDCVHPDLRVKFSRHKNGPVEKYRYRHREQAFPGKVSGSAGFFFHADPILTLL